MFDSLLRYQQAGELRFHLPVPKGLPFTSLIVIDNLSNLRYLSLCINFTIMEKKTISNTNNKKKITDNNGRRRSRPITVGWHGGYRVWPQSTAKIALAVSRRSKFNAGGRYTHTCTQTCTLSTGCLKFNFKKMKARIGKRILRRKCEMNMGLKRTVWRLDASERFVLYLSLSKGTTRSIKTSRVLGVPNHLE